ncbi:MAG: hypothetical protein H6Q15_2240 [Bacteroidetes bacterium]|nr:hypothetical protein [Bacteroidota bacterium]
MKAKNRFFAESFNARYMTFDEVANTFIKTADFERVIENCHTILMGSRGCGKTTLLKMLHPKALYHWDSKDAIAIKNRIPFYGIYIPSDRQWSRQLENFEKRFDHHIDFVKNVSRGLVNLNILIALCSTFNSLLELINKENSEEEIMLCKYLIQCWELERPITPTLYAITQKLNFYVRDINVAVNKGDTGINLPKCFMYDFYDIVGLGINAFEEVFKYESFFQSREFRWALCFDELEVAPKWLFDDLVQKCLRSRNQKILLKMTSTPDSDIDYNPIGKKTPSKKDDYEIIKMWVYNSRSQTEWRDFCDRYTLNLLYKRFQKKLDPSKIFGDYNIDDAMTGSLNINSYERDTNQFYPGGIAYEVFRNLSVIDKSFYRFLLKKGVDPLNPSPIEKSQESPVHRKIKPLVYYRYYFRKEGSKRSRKIVLFNHGKKHIYDLSDGNLRAFVNLMNELLKNVKLDSEGNPQKIKLNTQARVIEQFSKEYFYPRIVFYPDSNIQYYNKIISLQKIIDLIGNFFFEKIVTDNFSADPYSFFRFDDNCPKEFHRFLEIALESGGILMTEEEANVKGVRKGSKVYRLAYSLYPFYNLPQRDYNVIDLSRILEPLLSMVEEGRYGEQLSLNFDKK